MKPDEYGFCQKCLYHYYVTDSEESIEVTSGGAYNPLQQYCHYCLNTPRTRMIGLAAEWTGRTPGWCPRRKEQ